MSSETAADVQDSWFLLAGQALVDEGLFLRPNVKKISARTFDSGTANNPHFKGHVPIGRSQLVEQS
jgi:hypothetical protein